MTKSTQEALYELAVQAFLEGLCDDAPEQADFGVDDDARNEIVRRQIAA